MYYQVFEYFVFVVGEVYVVVIDVDCLCGQIKCDWIIFECGFVLVSGVVQQCVDVGQQFFDMEWFDQVIVGVLFEVFDFVLLV